MVEGGGLTVEGGTSEVTTSAWSDHTPRVPEVDKRVGEVDFRKNVLGSWSCWKGGRESWRLPHHQWLRA